jgi:hypothetical protein
MDFNFARAMLSDPLQAFNGCRPTHRRDIGDSLEDRTSTIDCAFHPQSKVVLSRVDAIEMDRKPYA